MLSLKKYILSFVFVDRNNSVNVVKKLEVIKNLFESYKIMPTKTDDDKIRIYLAFYNAKFSQQFEVDLATKMFFNIR